MKEADEFTIKTIGIPSLVLMERAAQGVVEIIEQQNIDKKKMLVVCGSGNNGGDGYAIARLLHLKGYDVSIFFVGKDESRSEENLLQKKICDYYEIPVVNDLKNQEYNVIVDAIFGTGLSREVSGMIKERMEELNAIDAFKVAVDIPSGINDATGLVMGTAFCADLTVAIAYMKRGIAMQPGNQYAGKVEIIDIGIYDDAISKEEQKMFCYDFEDLKERFPKRRGNTHKGSYGKVLMIVGSKGMAGASYLSAKAAYMTGAGLVQIYTHEDNRVILQESLPEAMVTTYESFDEEQIQKMLNWADVVAIGCGLGMSDLSRNILRYVVQNCDKTTVIDADGLNLLAEDLNMLKNQEGQRILTPHMKEMSRVVDCSVKELQENRVEILKKFTEEYKVTCVLKDARTVVSQKDKDLYLNMSGNSAMAKGGSGDVLTGIIAGTLAQSENTYESTCMAVYLHGLTGDWAKKKLGGYSVLASDLVNEIGEILKELDYFA